MERQSIILFCVLGYLLACLGIGLWAMRRTKSTHDFFVAGRDLGILVTGTAFFSSMMSGFGFVGGPGLVYGMGMSSLWIVAAGPLGYCLTFFVLAKRLRLLSELRDSVSLPDVVAARYRSETCRALTAVAIILGVLGYLGAQISSMAKVLMDLINHHPQLNDVSLELCMLVSCTVLVFYCVTGGIVASVYTDLVQGLVMVVVAVLVFLTAMRSFDGGMTAAVSTIEADTAEAAMPWGTLGMVGCLSWFFMFAVGGLGQPHTVTKFMMYRNVNDGRYILIFAIAGYCLSALLWIGIGIVMRAHVINGSHPPLTDIDHAASQFLQAFASPWLAGIVFAGLFSAVMSTADAFLNVGTAALVHDLPKAILRRTLVHELFWARVTTLLLAVTAALFSLYMNDVVALLGTFGWGTFAAALVPTVGIGLNWKRATAPAAIVAIASSLIFNFAIKLLNIQLPHGFQTGALSMLVSLILFLAISLASKPPQIDDDIAAVMEM